MRTRHITIYQANVGKGRANHLLALQLTYEAEFDIICIQEPWIFRERCRRITSIHPGYQTLVPLDSWETQAPRAITYTRKGAGLKVDQLRPFGPQQDIVVAEVNGLTIYNVYNQGEAVACLETAPPAPYPCPSPRRLQPHHQRWEPSWTRPATRHAKAFLRWVDSKGLILLNRPTRPLTLEAMFGSSPLHPSARLARDNYQARYSARLHLGSQHPRNHSAHQV